MPSIPFADNFLAGSIISLLMPVLLLIAIVVWYLLAVRRFGGDPRRAPTPLPPAPDVEGGAAPTAVTPDDPA